METLIYLENRAFPKVELLLSSMQERLAKITVSDLIDANVITDKLQNMLSLIRFHKAVQSFKASLVTFYNALHTKEKGNGETGF